MKSWSPYEMYTAPLGVGWMVTPHTHYGPAVDGYEYSKWGTYHFADRDGLGMDRTVATGTGFAGQYPKACAEPWTNVMDRLERQVNSAREWRDQVNTYFFRKSGVPDRHGRVVH